MAGVDPQEADTAPLAATPQVQYFDVSDVDSTDTEPEEAGGGDLGGEESDEELEVFEGGQVVAAQRQAAPRARGQAQVQPPSTTVAEAAWPEDSRSDPFGVKEEAAAPPLPLPPPPSHAAPTLFTGQGLVGSSAKASPADVAGQDAEDDDEFDYAFEGKAREGETHKRVFKADSVPVPVGLLADAKSKQLHSLCEEEEEEEEEEEQRGEEVADAMAVDAVAESDEWEAASANVAAMLAAQSRGAASPPRQVSQSSKATPHHKPSAPSAQPQTAQQGHNEPVMTRQQLPPQDSNAFFLDMEDIDIQDMETAAPVGVAHPLHETATPSIPSAYASSHAETAEAATHAAQSGDNMFLDPDDINLFGGEETATPAKQPKQKGASTSLSEPGPSQPTSSPSQSSTPASSRKRSSKTEKDKKGKREKKDKSKRSSIITSQKVQTYLATVDVSPYLGEIVEAEPDKDAGCFAKLLCKVLGPPKLASAELAEERSRIFCYAKMKFDEADPMHFKIISAVYQRFTSLPKPQRYGSHWADVGFQGNDPATDLRSCGVLGLVQLLHLWDHHPGNAAVIYNMSRDAVHEFPLAVVAMNVTKWCLQSMRTGRITAAANRAGGMTRVFMDLYVGSWYHLYTTWCRQAATMAESGFILKDAETYCRKSTGKILSLAHTCDLEAEAMNDVQL